MSGIEGKAILTEAEIRAAEARVPDLFGLMEKAGAAVARMVSMRWPKRSFVVLAGPGNNGGDGLVAARHLLEADMLEGVVLFQPLSAYRGEAARAARLFAGPVASWQEAEPLLAHEPVIIDALFGIGLARMIEGEYRAAIERINGSSLPVLAVDIASGIQSDTGRVMGCAIEADATMTFSALKPGHILYPGRQHAGETIIADVGLHVPAPKVRVNGPPRLSRPAPTAHKYERGYAMVLSSAHMPGAAALAAKAARRMGAGMVAVAGNQAVQHLHIGIQPGVVFHRASHPSEWKALLEDPRLGAVLVGSGWGPNVRPFVEAALAGASKLVLDGGALFPDIKARPDATLILTPHPGEFARMFPKLGGGKIAQAQWAADQTGAVIVLKGADTVIAAPNGEARVNVNASSALATAGSGDVLAGMILSLLAQGMDGFEAACAACALHGQAGIELGAGTIAEDIVEHLPAILKRK